MDILLVAATEAEISPLLSYLGDNREKQSEYRYISGNDSITICISGAGMMATAYHITRALAVRKYDIAIQAGIGGSFKRDIPLGELVWVTEERYGDMGAEDDSKFIDLFDLGFADANEPPFKNGWLITPKGDFQQHITFRQVKGITINTVSGYQPTIERLEHLYGADVESMEGAAFHYVCLMEGQPFVQIRSISNYIETRDKSKWEIGKAVAGLNNWLIEFLQKAAS